MQLKYIVGVLAVSAGLASCGKKSAPLTGTWKIVDIELKPDSLVKPGMLDKQAFVKVRFKFNADSTMVITDGTNPPSNARYTVKDSAKDEYIVLRPSAEEAATATMPDGTVPESKLRIVRHTSDKLDLEQTRAPYTIITHMEAVR